MNWRLNKLVILVVFWLAMLPQFVAAQYFGRNAVQIPSVGWMAFDSSFGAVNETPWGLMDQVQIGTGYSRDVAALKLWWVNETALGFARFESPALENARIAISIQGATGLRYNFFAEYWRPFAGVMLELIQFFNLQEETPFDVHVVAPTWFAVRPMFGLEWIFAEDMSVELEGGYVLMMNFNDPVRHSAMLRVSHRIYF